MVKLILITILIIFQTLQNVNGLFSISEPNENSDRNEDLRIIGGKITKPDEAKFMVAVYYLKPKNVTDYLCGGSLISETKILTSTYCLIEKNVAADELGNATLDPRKIRVGLGSVKLQYDRCELCKICAFYIHESFTFDPLEKDVFRLALIIIRGKGVSKYPDKLTPIQMWDKGLPNGTNCITYGWGTIDRKNITAYSEVLRHTNVILFDYDECIKRYYEERFLVAGDMCAEGINKENACYRDDGGPLVCKGKLLGVVPRGRFCMHKYGHLYLNVTLQKAWIDHGYKQSSIKAENPDYNNKVKKNDISLLMIFLIPTHFII